MDAPTLHRLHFAFPHTARQIDNQPSLLALQTLGALIIGKRALGGGDICEAAGQQNEAGNGP